MHYDQYKLKEKCKIFNLNKAQSIKKFSKYYKSNIQLLKNSYWSSVAMLSTYDLMRINSAKLATALCIIFFVPRRWV